MSSFQINGQDPPAGGIPRQAGYTYHLPAPVASDGQGRPIVNTSELPWLELTFSRLNKAAWDWYCSFLASHKMYGAITSIRLLNPYSYTIADGPDWVTYTGSYITIHKPEYGDIEYGNFFNVKIIIRGLS